MLEAVERTRQAGFHLRRELERARPRTLPSPQDVEMVRQYLLNREDMRPYLAQWDVSLEREKAIKGAIRDFLALGVLSLPIDDEIIDELFGRTASLGPLDELLRDPRVTDILVNGWDSIYYNTLAQDDLRWEGTFESPQHYRGVFDRLVAMGGGVVNEEDPSCDLTLPNGARVSADLPPVTPGPQLAIRLFRQNRFTLEELQALGVFDQQVRDYLHFLLEAYASGVIGGEVRSGKTTLLNALFMALPPGERIVTLEDGVRELRFLGQHWAPHYTKPETSRTGVRRYDLNFLAYRILRKAGRRNLVGEVRDKEALPLLLAASAGNCCWTTCHGSQAGDVLLRLVALALKNEEARSAEAVRLLCQQSLDAVIMVGRCRDGRRRILSIDEVVEVGAEGIRLMNVFTLNERGGEYTWQRNPDYAMTPRLRRKQEEAGLRVAGGDLRRAAQAEGFPRRPPEEAYLDEAEKLLVTSRAREATAILASVADHQWDDQQGGPFQRYLLLAGRAILEGGLSPQAKGEALLALVPQAQGYTRRVLEGMLAELSSRAQVGAVFRGETSSGRRGSQDPGSARRLRQAASVFHGETPADHGASRDPAGSGAPARAEAVFHGETPSERKPDV